jgi:CRP-like cAMP-binding protein
LQPVELIENDLLFRRDAGVDGCYFVERGALKVSVEDHTGGQTWLAIVGAGDWVGELGLLDRHPRSATVTALTACRLWAPLKEV